MATYGRYLTGDDGIALPFDDHSFTGETSVELSLHGATISVQRLVEACVDFGARLAEPGEYSLRAFLNGKVDLTQAEAIADTVAAATERQLRQANLLRAGAMKSRIRQIREELLAAIAEVEAQVDFSEEVGDMDRFALARRLAASGQAVEELIVNSSAGRLLRNGIRVAIVGPPNAGKSSLLNALAGSSRAIVNPRPGTTRDFLEVTVEISGWPVVFIDTAGLRTSQDDIEVEGIARSHEQAQSADLVLYVFDASAGLSETDREKSQAYRRSLLIANKTDLAPPPYLTIGVSALTGQGLGQLQSGIVKLFDQLEPDTLFVNPRQLNELKTTAGAIDHAGAVLRQDLPLDLVVVHLSEAVDSLGRVTGETASPDILDEIFSRFCIGK
ncbi:MAG: tRNA modification GTPase MnmE [Fimbriimonadaceae bacterium]|nr:tRNA modification GTPase MnmE [Fimbriimonadaceae bacterium]